MRSYKNKIVPLSGMLIAIAAGAIGIAHSQGQNQPNSKKSAVVVLQDIDVDQLPVVKYKTPKSSDPKRKAKGERYSKHLPGSVGPTGDELPANSTVHWWLGIPALPAAKSDAVVIGEISDAQAYLANDNAGLYSEFTVQLNEVLKNNNNDPLVGSVTVEREGGAIQFPNGRVKQFRLSKQGMPRVGRQYVLFLKSNGQGQDYTILTGYELRAGHVFPLDGQGAKLVFSRYAGFGESEFLNEVRATVAEPLQPSIR